ncbi:MAG: hypothetical protein JKY42_04885 [Flavobacteriales bacterium]|nr:hypothetical protein [Flavobacteriales bacterium]
MHKQSTRQSYSMFILILLVSCLGCSTLKTKKKINALSVLSATSQKWFSGQKNGGRGTNYVIIVVANYNKLIIDSLHFPEFTSKIGVMKGSSITSSIAAGDSLTLKVGALSPLAIQSKGEISYASNKTIKRQLVEFKQLKDLYYP